MFAKLFGKSSEKDKPMKREQTGMKRHNPIAGMSMARDPVCGAEVNKEKAPAMFSSSGPDPLFLQPLV
ncbi:MAG: hypothetical protein HY665_02720 [Chloroflexi bacterium]|nr:hypothetical protein [Chloroflexota bacterium]